MIDDKATIFKVHVISSQSLARVIVLFYLIIVLWCV